MKFAITKLEQFALTSHLIGQPSPTPEHGRKRLRAWDELGVSELADQLATMAVGFGNTVKVADWSDRSTPVFIDINADVLDYLIAGLRVQIMGVWADTLTRVLERLERLRDKTYELPKQA